MEIFSFFLFNCHCADCWPCELSIFSLRTASFRWSASNYRSWSQQLPLVFTWDSSMAAGVDRLLDEEEDGVLQGTIEGKRVVATGWQIGEVCSESLVLSSCKSRRIWFSDRDLSIEIRGLSCPRGTTTVGPWVVQIFKEHNEWIADPSYWPSFQLYM